MRSEPAIIDLGMYSYHADPGQAPEPDQPWRIRAWFAGLRPWLLPLLVTALVSSLGAAAPDRPGLTLIWTVPESSGTGSAQYVLADTDLYVLAPGDGGSVMLTAYRLADGALRWRVPLANLDGAEQPSLPALWARLVGDVPVVVTSGPVASAAVYDPATGQPRWVGAGEMYFRGDDLVGSYQYSPRRGARSKPRLTVRRTGSGTVVATVAGVQEGAFDFWRDPGGAVHLLTLRADGELIRVDLATGSVVGSTSIADRGPDDGLLRLEVIGDLVLLSGLEGVVAYDAATLKVRWRVPDGFVAIPCGALVCVDAIVYPESADPRLEAVDPSTGTYRWSVGCPVGQFANCHLSVDELGSGDRLLMQAYPIDRHPWEPTGYAWIVAADSGRRLTEPVDWLVADQPGANGALLTREISPVDRDDPPSLDREPPQHWWARSGPDLDRIEIMGVVEAHQCQARDPYLVCQTQGEPLEVWRIA